MNRTSVTFPATMGGALGCSAGVMLAKGEYWLGVPLGVLALVFMLLADRAMNNWVNYWEALLRVKR